MRRREFIKRAAPLAAAPVLFNGLRLRALARPRTYSALARLVGSTDRVLVVIQLQGGNDGLNTVIPVEDDLYYNLRPHLGIPRDTALALAGTSLRMHPSAIGMQRLFNDGRLAIVENIGYTHATLSHFSDTEIWNTASSNGVAHDMLTSGWLGRLLQQRYPAFPDTLPEDPPAMEIAVATSSIFAITGTSIAMSLTDPNEFYDLVNGGPSVGSDAPDDTPAGHEKTFIDGVDRQSRAYAESVRRAAGKATNKVAYPENNRLAQALAIIARLVAGGLATPVYKVTIGNFDTHADQAPRHAALLALLGDAIKAFHDDLVALGVDDRVVGMTYSEFGRRANENGDGAPHGTDHGTAAPHFVFGTPVDGGRVLGGLPDLAHLDRYKNLPHSIEFPCYFASVLGGMYDIGDTALDGIFPFGHCGDGERLELFHASSVPSSGAMLRGGIAGTIVAAPSVTATQTVLTVTLAAPARLRTVVYDAAGRRVMQLPPRDFPAGATMLGLDLAPLATGAYTIALEGSGVRLATRVGVVR